MKTRPKALVFLAVAFAAIAASFPVQIMLLYHISPLELSDVVYKLTSVNWVVILSCLWCSYLAWQASPKLLWALPLNFMAVTYNNYLVGALATDYSGITALISVMAFGFLHLVLLSPKARAVLKDPKRRWWMTEPRVKISCPLSFQTVNGQSFKGSSFDISKTGAFIPIPLDEINYQKNTAPKQLVKMRLNLGRFKEVTFEAEVVRATSAKGNYPEGIGIRFLDLSRDTRRELDHFLSEHNMFHSRA